MELQAIIDALRKDYIDPLANQFPLPFEPNQIDLANRKINWRPGQKEKLANDSVSFAAGNNPAMMLSALKHLPETEFSKAHALAQKNAALPIEQGGLGLHPDNTAMERARALGFDVDSPVYHGTGADITEFNPLLSDTRRKTGTPKGAVVVTSEPNTANTYANAEYGEWSKNYGEGGNVLSLLVNKGKNLKLNARNEGYDPNWNDIYSPKYPEIETTNDFALLAKNKKKDSATIKNIKDNAVMSGAIGDTTFIFDPKNIRSRFAAFDPLKKNSANILASALLGVGLARGEDK